jgi:hypothetical protein
MKYLITLSFMLTLAVSAQSQWWFDAGVKGAWGPTGMSDQNVYDDANYKHLITTGTSIGGRLGFNYGYHVGLSVEYAGATSNQDFEYNNDLYNSYQWKHNDISTLFRYSGNGAYVELGATFSNVKSVELDNVNLGVTDVSENFVDNYTSAVFGVGSYLMGTELLTVNLGLRFHWSFDDMVNATGKENNYPIVVEELKDPSVKTQAAAAQLQLEINYAFGRFSKEGCHDRWKLILFQ